MSGLPAPRARQIVAAVIGNALEWYDFIIFGNLTIVISRLFFPAESQYASLLLTTATFGVGFFMRPVGGILLGIYADRKGRKAAPGAGACLFCSACSLGRLDSISAGISKRPALFLSRAKNHRRHWVLLRSSPRMRDRLWHAPASLQRAPYLSM